jgi:TctA family transporter
MVAVWRHRLVALRGGLIGAGVGVLPGLGGAAADWLSYGATIAANPDQQFGKGNIIGVIGCEGANNAHKATSMIPTVLFGIPGAPFAAVFIALLSYLGFELGTVELAGDRTFFSALSLGFLLATLLVAAVCLVAGPLIARVTRIPYRYYFPVVLLLIVWACVQYTGRWEDYAILALCSALGLFCKRFRLSRPALLLGFILSNRIEAYTIQLTSIYDLAALLQRPLFLALCATIVGILLWGTMRKTSFNYE